MKTKLMTIFTRTPLHVGCGSSVGAVDQPVARERHTGFPVIPGSALKGVLADLWLDRSDPKNPIRSQEGKILFGEDDVSARATAGKILIGDSKLLAFPIRSAKGCFAWITCPMVLARFDRDTFSRFSASVSDPGEGKVFVAPGSDVVLSRTVQGTEEKDVVFEEYALSAVEDERVGRLAETFDQLCSDKVWKDLLVKKLAVVDDETFAYFAKNACEIAQHNRISDVTNTVDGTGFFNQENVPSETLFYALLSCLDEDIFEKKFVPKIQSEGILQIGADMTTGLGWCSTFISSIV